MRQYAVLKATEARFMLQPRHIYMSSVFMEMQLQPEAAAVPLLFNIAGQYNSTVE
jgi:hypothetical protein